MDNCASINAIREGRNIHPYKKEQNSKMNENSIEGRGEFEGLGQTAHVPRQSVNLIAEEKVQDIRTEENKQKYTIENIICINKPYKGYKIITNNNNKREVRTTRDRQYYDFHYLTLKQIYILNGNERKIEEEQRRDTQHNKRRVASGAVNHLTKESTKRAIEAFEHVHV